MHIKRKTIWHWKNIGKTCLALPLWVGIWAEVLVYSGMNMVVAFFLMLLFGIIGAEICMSRWKLWHFE